MTTPETPDKPEAKAEQDAETKSVATDSPAPAEQAAPAAPSTNGANHEQETKKIEVGKPAEGAETSSAPPPWQRVTADNAAIEAETVQAPTVSPVAPSAYPQAPAGYSAPAVDTSSQATTNFRPVVTGTAAAAATPGAAAAGAAARTSVNLGGAGSARGGAAPTALRRPGRGPRRASLQVKRVDPWSVLKLALVLGFAMFLVWMVAVGVLYGVLQGMGVWNKLNGTYNDLVQGGDTSGGDLINVGRVFGVAAVVGLVNVILFTALGTVSAFIYNVSADLAGGIEVTLSERE
ncbi:hypothetical protein KALB_8 [Kutzneria albida DSM 43870]|uniref:DUF3566 domain-containing protein n=1 Tax=Kutzneria albida DSM 43870 TaxID=1449976 RepID=W5VY79_9PSEU|nr:DUF3566 domain-containing protein [Kutzneria albida]AHH93385.1 hypothetical protein KALB_8 [Kutzneria albida DSM 43870]